jgi:CheY-like chemotaxis protein
MDGDLNQEQLKQVNYIESSARDLHDMVNDLLDLAKVEAGKIRIRSKRFEVHELFSALKGMLKPLLADNNSVDLVFEDAGGILPLRTDEGKVSQILRNLISNALKFTPQGKVTVSAEAMDNRDILFTVADTGIGIAAEHHESIFKEFSQVENPLQERYRGTGLGLPLCRNLAMLLGGKIWLESELGKGSKFFVRIPAVYVGELSRPDETNMPAAPEFHRAPVLILEDDEETARRLEFYLRDTEFQAILASSVAQSEVWTARHTPVAVVADVYLGDDQSWGFISRLRERLPELPIIVTSVPDEAQFALARGGTVFLPKPIAPEAFVQELRRLTSNVGTCQILLVDDNEVARYILRDLLSLPWLDIREASSGTEAISMLNEKLPDAIILDLLMPDISGFEILRQLRTDQATRQLPVLIYTSKVLSEAERALLDSWEARIVRKEDISTRLSAQPFFDWIRSVGLAPNTAERQLDG